MKCLFHGTPSAALFFALLGCNSTGMPRTDKIRATVNPSEALGVDRSLALDCVLHNVTPSLGNRLTLPVVETRGFSVLRGLPSGTDIVL